MGIRENKEAVKIDDWVHDVRGSLIGWVNATDEAPADFNGEAVRMVYSPHSDASKSWLKKLFAGVARFAFDAFGSTYGFEVTDDIYPKNAIDGYPDGMTVNGFSKEIGTPDKRVILRNNVEGQRKYMDAVGPESDNIDKTRSELQERIDELEMMLEAEESKNDELSEQVDREEGSSNNGMHGYGPEEYGMHSDEFRGDME